MTAYFRITRSGGLYEAYVSPSHMKGPWGSPKPMKAKELFEALVAIGINGVDVWEAFFECDPDFLKRNPDMR